MKNLLKIKSLSVIVLLAMTLQGCYVEVHHVPAPPGPDGYPGNAFFGVSYEAAVPYSYWDDNPSIPFNPTLGQYYGTGSGLFNFEYFINPEEFWYGTYEIWRNPGHAGLPDGIPGADGLDSYLMLICDPLGYHEHRGNGKTGFSVKEVGEKLIIESQAENARYRITIQKGKPGEESGKTPKFQS